MDINEIDLRYRSRLQAVAFRMVRDWHDAEDIANEAIFAAVRAYDPARGSLEALLFTSVRNKANNYIQKRNRLKRRGTVSLQIEPSYEDAGALLPSAIDTLPPNQQEIVRLQFWEELPERTIALQLGITRHQVRRLQFMALAALMTVLD